MENFGINEYFNADGEPHSFTCDGHVDSMTFRDQCEKSFFIRPRKVQHTWLKSKWIKRDPEKRFSRGYSTQVSCPHYVKGAQPVTVGLIH